MKITPQDIHHKEFKRGIRGYNEEEVDLFLDQLAEQFENLYKKSHSFEEEILILKERLGTYQNIEMTLQNTLLTAQKSAEEVQLNAKNEADAVLNDAKIEAKNILKKVEKQKQILSEAFAKLKSLETMYKQKIRENLDSLLDKLNRIDGEEQTLLEDLEKEFAKIPDIEIPKVEDNNPPAMAVQVAPSNQETENIAQAEPKTQEDDDPAKADASKSDIATEAEIDAFLQQEHPEIGNEEMPTESKGTLLGRIFKKKEAADEEVVEEVAKDDVGRVSQTRQEEEKPKKAKTKKKKDNTKHTEELKV